MYLRQQALPLSSIDPNVSLHVDLLNLLLVVRDDTQVEPTVNT